MAGRPSVAYYRDLRVRMGAGRIRLAKIYRAVQRGLTCVDVAKKRGELGARRCKPARVGRAAAGLRIDQIVTAVEDRDVIVIEIGLQPLVDALLDPFRVEILADVLHGRRRRGDAVYLAQHAFTVQGECAAEHLLLVLKGHLIGVLRGREHATTMQAMATATITPIGTTTLNRARSQWVYCRSPMLRARAATGKALPLKVSCPLNFFGRTLG